MAGGGLLPPMFLRGSSEPTSSRLRTFNLKQQPFPVASRGSQPRAPASAAITSRSLEILSGSLGAAVVGSRGGRPATRRAAPCLAVSPPLLPPRGGACERPSLGRTVGAAAVSPRAPALGAHPGASRHLQMKPKQPTPPMPRRKNAAPRTQRVSPAPFPPAQCPQHHHHHTALPGDAVGRETASACSCRDAMSPAP